MKKTVNLKPGDRVVRNNKYYVPRSEKGVVFTVATAPFDIRGSDYVKLIGTPGVHAVDALDKVADHIWLDKNNKRSGQKCE